MFISLDTLFLETLSDLRKRVSSGKDYDLVRAAGLCRHLLLDRNPLLDLTNAKYKIKIQFLVSRLCLSDVINSPMDMIWTTILPTKLSPSVMVTRHKFLGIRCLRIREHVYTVNDIIRAASHCMGGIHSLKPEDEKETVLNNLEYKAENTPKSHRTNHIAISAVCKSVIIAMKPLEEIISKHTPTGGL